VSDGPEWFAPKRYGYGAGVPISWQGWMVSLVYAAAVVIGVNAFRERPLVIAAIVIPLTAALITIAARTTRGGWRWRWGDPD
jgi:hypothetical protein